MVTIVKIGSSEMTVQEAEIAEGDTPKLEKEFIKSIIQI